MKWDTRMIKSIILVCLISIFFIVLYFLYNFVRFGSIFEFGLNYVVEKNQFFLAIVHYKLFSTKYVLRNLYYYYLNIPIFSLKYPFIAIDRQGNSVFIIYPLLLSLLFFLKRGVGKFQKKVFIFLIGMIILLHQIFFMCYAWTGYTQLGNRYFFEIIPLFFVLILFVINYVPNVIKFLILFFGLLINIFGVLAFYSINFTIHPTQLIYEFFKKLLNL